MMTSKSLVALPFILLLSSSCVHQGSSEPDLNQFLQGLAQGSVTSLHEIMQCMQKLVPCKPYLKNSLTTVDPPPPTCCLPLKEMLADDVQCLCKFFDDPQVLNSMNITQEDALKLPEACGVHADVSLCKKEADASAPTHAAAASDNSATDKVPTTTEKSDSTKNVTPYRITHFGVMATFAALMISSQFFSA